MHKYLQIYLSIIVLSSASMCHALKCYVCDNQENNTQKCLKTIRMCEQGEDVCLTEIKWGSTPYWSQGTKKQFYISKWCSTEKECKRIRRSNMPLCTHLWYQDWKCYDCCQGDGCNYYIFSNAHISRPIYGMIFFMIFLSVIGYR